MKVESTCVLENFRKFLILSTCNSYIPREFIDDDTIFPERMADNGTMYVEAEDKETVKKIGELTFVKAIGILGVIYNSKSGNTKLKWRSIQEKLGKITGEASANSLVNLFEAGALDRSYPYENKNDESLKA